MCEKTTLRRKQDLIRPHFLKRNSSHAVRTHKAHRGAEEQGEDEEEATRAASCASASLQRVTESRRQHRQERKDEVSGQKDKKHQADKRVGKEHEEEKEGGQYGFPFRVGTKGNGVLGVKSPLFHHTLGKRRRWGRAGERRIPVSQASPRCRAPAGSRSRRTGPRHSEHTWRHHLALAQANHSTVLVRNQQSDPPPTLAMPRCSPSPSR